MSSGRDDGGRPCDGGLRLVVYDPCDGGLRLAVYDEYTSGI
jgi:hypothetical protein